jgi:hypothetical protein
MILNRPFPEFLLIQTQVNGFCLMCRIFSQYFDDLLMKEALGCIKKHLIGVTSVTTSKDHLVDRECVDFETITTTVSS